MLRNFLDKVIARILPTTATKVITSD
jgi:hypothetical protein